MATKELICDAMLQHIIKGIASSGSRKCSRITPETAEKAKPENPETTPPACAAAPRNRLVVPQAASHSCVPPRLGSRDTCYNAPRMPNSAAPASSSGTGCMPGQRNNATVVTIAAAHTPEPPGSRELRDLLERAS